ncbi:MAG: anhydro-N-acetylmuramic acid kinase [Chloroflexi bacterium]|nr:anhydro-N-acetylmuramic acid kinase [Chloroflexota bacterium]
MYPTSRRGEEFAGSDQPGMCSAMDKALNIIGVMSGTSVDAVDAVSALVRGSRETLSVEELGSASVPYPALLRTRVLQACDPRQSVSSQLICELNVEVAELHARAVQELLHSTSSEQSAIDAVCTHGQTIWHQGKPSPGHPASTLQIGEPGVIAERTGITTVANFRPRDIAAGGQGAPLVSYVDWALYRSSTQHRALQNLGGIGNVTVLPANCSPDQVFAFDTGPANVLIDSIVRIATKDTQAFDVDGQMAQRGTIDPELLESILSHPFLHTPPPKTTGREDFGMHYAEAVWQLGEGRALPAEDIIATCTAATAHSIRNAYVDFVLPRVPVTECYVSGGGLRNPTLVDQLRTLLAPVRVLPIEVLGIDGQHKEALAFAVLGAETLRGVPSSIPGATGAAHSSVLGVICPGRNFPALMARLYTGMTVDVS